MIAFLLGDLIRPWIKGVVLISSVTIRNLPDVTHRALTLRAAQHGRSTESEISDILDAAVAGKLGLGTALAAIGRAAGGVNLQLRRDQRSVDVAAFE